MDFKGGEMGGEVGVGVEECFELDEVRRIGVDDCDVYGWLDLWIFVESV